VPFWAKRPAVNQPSKNVYTYACRYAPITKENHKRHPRQLHLCRPRCSHRLPYFSVCLCPWQFFGMPVRCSKLFSWLYSPRKMHSIFFLNNRTILRKTYSKNRRFVARDQIFTKSLLACMHAIASSCMLSMCV
jgi:hypothetical protein